MTHILIGRPTIATLLERFAHPLLHDDLEYVRPSLFDTEKPAFVFAATTFIATKRACHLERQPCTSISLADAAYDLFTRSEMGR
jgi:hypothetical protein